MKFFDRFENDLYLSMSDLKEGCYPITNSGVWHSGIHVYFPESNNEIIKNPIAGQVVTSNFTEKKDWHYIVIENDIDFPDKRKGKVFGYHCYNLISNIMDKMPYNDLIGKKQLINENVLTKLKDVPFYISIKTQLPRNTCRDRDNYKIFNINLNKTESHPLFNPEEHINGYDNLTSITNTDTVIKDAIVKSSNGKIVGTVKNNFAINSNEFVDSNVVKEINIKGSNLKLYEGLPKGYVILGKKTINNYGNIVYKKGMLIYLWSEKEENIRKYPNFGLVVKKDLKIWNKISDLLSEERKKELKALLESNNKKEEYIFVIEKEENIFPFVDEESTNKLAYKIKDSNGKIVHKFLLQNNEFNLLKKELVGFFKNNDFYHSCSELWTENHFSYDLMERIDIGEEYNYFFNSVKAIDTNNNPITSYDNTKTKLLSPYYFKAQLHCLRDAFYQGTVAVESIFKKMIYISDPYALYAFKDTSTLDGLPCSEQIGIPSSEFEFSNVEEILQNIIDKKDYIWLKNSEMQVYVNKKIYKDLQIEIVKNEVKKGTYVGVGAKLGLPCWKEAPQENERPASKPYIDYALFFTEDITTKENRLEKITLKEDEKCFEEVKNYTEDSGLVFIPPHATDIVYKTVENRKDCVKLESVTYKAYVYPKWIYNSKLKTDNAVILFYSQRCTVEITNGEITSITPRFSEEQEDLIKSIVNEIFPKMKTQKMESTTDGIGNPVFRFTYVKSYNQFVKNDLKLTDTCKFLSVFKESTDFIESRIPEGGYTDIMSSTSIDDKTINGVICNGFIIKSKLYYVPKETVEDGKSNLLADLMENAKILNFGNKAIATKTICPENELLIQEETGKENIRKLRKILREDLEKENKDLVNYIYTDRKDYGFKIYDGEKQYTTLLQNYLCKFISKHPIEFDFDKFEKGYVSKKRDLKPFDKNKDSDVYAGLKAADSAIFGKNSFYFACAPYFYNKMEELGLMFENPYQGVNEYSRLGRNKDPKYEFKINPGFAPCCEEKGSGGKFIYERNINGKTWYFAALNNPFGYSNGYFSKTLFHTGIDYPGTNDENVRYAPIMALVPGRIWACTTGNGRVMDSDPSGGYGRCMVIKGDNGYLYLLGHLQDFAGHKAGDYVSFGEIVAHAGNTGNSDAQHLHLELIECKTGMGDIEKESVLNMTYNQLHESDGGIKDNCKAILRFAVGEETLWKIKKSEDWKNQRLNPLTGEKA